MKSSSPFVFADVVFAFFLAFVAGFVLAGCEGDPLSQVPSPDAGVIVEQHDDAAVEADASEPNHIRR